MGYTETEQRPQVKGVKQGFWGLVLLVDGNGLFAWGTLAGKTVKQGVEVPHPPLSPPGSSRSIYWWEPWALEEGKGWTGCGQKEATSKLMTGTGSWPCRKNHSIAGALEEREDASLCDSETKNKPPSLNLSADIQKNFTCLLLIPGVLKQLCLTMAVSPAPR